jgi:uncharacterized protein with GYD domain
MPHYLLQVAYTPEAWATMSKNPQNRIDAVRPAVEGLGGKIETGYLCFGEYDLMLIAELPSNTEAAAMAIAASAGGALKSVKTTPLLTAAEGVEAMKRTSFSGYEPPG